MTPLQQVLAPPIWQGPVEVKSLFGGITNQNFHVRDSDRQAVVRIGGDIPFHQILRFNELSARPRRCQQDLAPAD